MSFLGNLESNPHESVMPPESSCQVNQIATAAEEQTATTNEVTTNILQINEVVGQTARGAEETASAAGQLSTQAQELQNLVSKFRLT